ncbi:hypothetical protein SH580_11045 [Coraliomargarita algicola]|uniref:Uncharacterized protein n=1 Tax=Coraliomargarita algicola TaxID=3092156 RepID=A0ABZ0RFZ1_9BACT|nr:hypothetical protein [Coraliomargarita sp. J2-16]WPJ93973.1 hypothetical protein SH580_11045 [Coraliomargarita sp. J2-16]
MADINKAPDQDVTVEELLRLKRAERPDDAFWGTFDQELHQRMLQTLVKKDPWYVQLLRGVSGRIAQTAAVGAAAAFLATLMLRPAFVELVQSGGAAGFAQQMTGANVTESGLGNDSSVASSALGIDTPSDSTVARAVPMVLAMSDLETAMTPDYKIEAISAGVDAAYTQDYAHDTFRVAAYDSAAYVADTASFAGSGLATGLVY